MLKAAHTTASAEVKLTFIPKKLPFPSIAIDCHHSAKLCVIWAPVARPVRPTPLSLSTWRADMTTLIPSHAAAVKITVPKANTTGR